MRGGKKHSKRPDFVVFRVLSRPSGHPRKEAFRVNTNTRKKWLRRKRRIEKRLRPRQWRSRPKPMFTAGNIRYEMADRTRALAHGGIGAVHLLARKVGLVDAID